MINITFQKRSGLCLRAEGHADFSQGNDIVCAAVSSLIETLASFVSTKSTGNGIITLGKGYAEIIDNDPNDLPFFEFTIHGLTLISSEYPQNVRIKIL